MLAVAALLAFGEPTSSNAQALVPTSQIERLPPVAIAAPTSFVAPLVITPSDPNVVLCSIAPVEYLMLEPPSGPTLDSQTLSQSLLDASPFTEPLATPSPPRRFSFFRDGEWYFSWGESRDFWNPTDIHISQPSLNNNFTVHDVQGHDEPDWKGGLFGSQYNVRIGRFFGEKRRHGLEFSLDHTKYSSTIGQTALVTGTINGQPVNEKMVLYQNVFDYELHNGANHAMCNYVHRVPLRGELNQKFSVAGIGKIGAARCCRTRRTTSSAISSTWASRVGTTSSAAITVGGGSAVGLSASSAACASCFGGRSISN